MSRRTREHVTISSDDHGGDDHGGGGGHGGGDSRWLVTYADLLTLLMVLFLVLWVISTIDLAKFEKFKSGLGDFGNPAATAAGGGAGTGEDPCATVTTDAPAEGDGHSSTTEAAAEDDSHSSTTDAPAEGDGHSTDTEAPAEDDSHSSTTEAASEGESHSTDTEAPAEDDSHSSTTEAAAEDDSHSSTTEAAAEGEHGAAAEGDGHSAATEAPADPCLGEGEAGTPGPGGGASTSGGGAGHALTEGELPALADKVQEEIDAAGLPDVISVSVEERGLVIMVTTDNVLFGSGAAEISLDGAAMIGAIAPTLNDFTNAIVVEGHTDKRPLRRVGYDNWDLSVDRAVSVVKLLRSVYGVDPERLSARGYGEMHPIADGDDEASFARNRRVEIVVLAQTPGEAGTDTATTEAPAEGTETDTATTEAPAEGTETVTTEAGASAETPATEAPTEG
jgi:flagellar motor protein MotB